ncbi:MAG: chitobiase/beta-hexosaminidase C-terminal domain-containing protein, partial [Alistipes sp.]
MRKRIVILCTLVLNGTMFLLAEGSESLANAGTKYELTDTQTFTGDNGLQWTAVGACDTEVGAFKALTISAGVTGNGLSGNLTDEQTAQGVGIVSFQVKGAKAGTGYGLRTFRVTVGDYSKDVTLNVPSMTNSYTFRDTVKQVGVSTLCITALETVTDETATFYLYNVQWTSYNGRTDMPTLAIADDTDSEFAVGIDNDTVYYAEKPLSAQLASTSAGAVFYYTTDGTPPTISSTSGAVVTLPLDATTTVRAIAVTEADGISDEASWTITTAKGQLVTNDCSDAARWEGTQALYNTARGVSKSNNPYYRFNDIVVTEVYRYPKALSLYANNASNHTLTLSYQTGTYCFENGDSVWQASSEWTVLRTIEKTEFVSNSMKRFQIALPDAAKSEFIRVQLKASGTSIYVDDVNAVVADMPQVALPAFSQSGGQVSAGTQVTLSCATDDAIIYYSVNGSVPQIYTSPIVVNGKTEVRAYAVKDGMSDSYTAVALYRLPTVNAPTFDKPDGSTLYLDDVVTISCTNEAAVVHYSINGSDFVTATGASASITVVDDVYSVAAYTACDGLMNSDTITMTYTTAKVLKPEITSGDERAVAPGTTISINCATSGAILHYRVNEGTWQESTSGLVRDIAINEACTVYAYATKDNYLNSDTLCEVFTVTKGTLAPPTADYADGTLLAA